MIYKTNESTIVIQAEARDQQRSDVVFWSHDRGTAKLRMKLMQKSGVPQTLPDGTTVPIRLTFQSNTAQDGIGKHDYLATIEDKVNGIVSIVLQDNILGYVGIVHGSVYLNFPENKSLDTAGRFSFEIRRSPIDESTPELEDYYFNGFSQTIDKVEKMIADAKKEIDTKLADTNSKITKANNDLTTLNTNLNKTQTQIGELGKLKREYSNSIDFGSYDYSGNPNLMSVIKASDFNNESDVSVSDVGYNSIRLTTQGINRLSAFTSNSIPSLVSGKTYTISAKVKIEDGTTGNIDKLRISYRKANGGTMLLSATTNGIEVGKEITIKSTGIVNYEITDLAKFYLTIDTEGSAKITGSVIVSDIKIEEGSTATPYQPNLLDAPYYLSKVALGKNIANKAINYPIKTSDYLTYTASNIENYQANQTYTLTLKATKPVTQSLGVYLNNGAVGAGTMLPVEGKIDQWSLTFKVTQTQIDQGVTNNLSIFQMPAATKGAVTIDWIKLEKGDTRTPNIPQYKYFGESLKDSNNPNDYSWDITPEFTESGLNNSVNLTSPQTVLGIKNFKDGLQVNGNQVATVEEDTGWINLTATNGHSWGQQGQIRKIGKRVMFRGSLKGTTLNNKDFCTIPEKFRPSNTTDNYEYQFLLPPQSTNTLDNGGMAYIRPSGICGLPSYRGSVNLFLAPIQYFVD